MGMEMALFGELQNISQSLILGFKAKIYFITLFERLLIFFESDAILLI